MAGDKVGLAQPLVWTDCLEHDFGSSAQRECLAESVKASLQDPQSVFGHMVAVPSYYAPLRSWVELPAGEPPLAAPSSGGRPPFRGGRGWAGLAFGLGVTGAVYFRADISRWVERLKTPPSQGNLRKRHPRESGDPQALENLDSRFRGNDKETNYDPDAYVTLMQPSGASVVMPVWDDLVADKPELRQELENNGFQLVHTADREALFQQLELEHHRRQLMELCYLVLIDPDVYSHAYVSRLMNQYLNQHGLLLPLLFPDTPHMSTVEVWSSQWDKIATQANQLYRQAQLLSRSLEITARGEKDKDAVRKKADQLAETLMAYYRLFQWQGIRQPDRLVFYLSLMIQMLHKTGRYNDQDFLKFISAYRNAPEYLIEVSKCWLAFAINAEDIDRLVKYSMLNNNYNMTRIIEVLMLYYNLDDEEIVNPQVIINLRERLLPEYWLRIVPRTTSNLKKFGYEARARAIELRAKLNTYRSNPEGLETDLSSH